MTDKLYPCLWFDGKAREAAEFYCSIFPNSAILADTGMVVTFSINGNRYMGLNGGPHFQFNEAVSFVVECENQEEIDHYWNHLTDGGEESQCGWLKDRYGLSWQIVPTILNELMADPERGPRVIQAFMKMRKFDVAALLNA
jgi:predicted 3-demethylubiquinone-9 3-methyltransferase (glyoxalase superfamily)